MKVGREETLFAPVHIELENAEEVEYVRVLLNIRKGVALDRTQANGVGAVASRTQMRETFQASI